MLSNMLLSPSPYGLLHQSPAQGAKRAAARWHPYAQRSSTRNTPADLGGSCSFQPKPLGRSSRSKSQLISPPRSNSSFVSNISSFPSAASTPQCQPSYHRSASTLCPATQGNPLQKGERSFVHDERNKYASDLVESTVALVTEVWNLPFEPPAPVIATPVLVRSQSSMTFSKLQSVAPTASLGLNALPLTPTSLPSASPPVALSPAVSTSSHASFVACPAPTKGIRHFVHEVLRRSRTSCSTLEVGMCYISAARPLIIQLQAHAHILQTGGFATFEGLKPLDELLNGAEKDLLSHPLLDARRAFLAAMVLAGKFLQDKAYSNKAWAKLSGLDAKEITRCERALGDALGWRLWVGKTTTDEIEGTHDPLANSLICAALAAERGVSGNGRIVARTQSDGGLFAVRKQEVAAGFPTAAPNSSILSTYSSESTPIDDNATLLNTVTATPFSIADFIDFDQCDGIQDLKMQAVASYKTKSKVTSPMMEDISTPIDLTASPMKLSSTIMPAQPAKRVRDLCKVARANSFDAALAARGISRQYALQLGVPMTDSDKGFTRVHTAPLLLPGAHSSRPAPRSLLHAYEQLSYNGCPFDLSSSSLHPNPIQGVQEMVHALEEASRWNLESSMPA